MYLVKMTALRPLTGDWGNANELDSFTTNNVIAERLEARGLAERYREPVVASKDEMELAEFLAKMSVPVANKMLTPQENKAPTLDPEPPAPALPEPMPPPVQVQHSRTFAEPMRRRGRPRKIR